MFQFILESFSALVSKWPVSPKWLVGRRAKQIDIFGTGGGGWAGGGRGTKVCIWGTFDLSGFKVIMGSVDALLKMTCNSKTGEID